MNELKISQSLIKKFFYKGEKRDYCPYQIHCETIIKSHNRTTDAMIAGSYFETLCLGSGINDQKTEDMARKRLTAKQIMAKQTIGDKTIDQIRVEQQAMIFERQSAIYQISVQKEINTQVKLVKMFSENDNIILQGELDIFPTTILLPERGIRLCVIDLKLTGRFTDWGEYCWGSPSSLDTIQGLFYNNLVRDIDIELNAKHNPGSKISYLFTGPIKHQIEKNEPLFFYWVFNYKEKEISNKFIEVGYDNMGKAELKTSITRTIEEYNKNERNGWTKTNPSYDKCSTCAVLDCVDRMVFKNEEQTNVPNNFEKI